MTFFHYTHIFHAEEILKDGYINVTDSITSMRHPNLDTDVVWLLDVDDAHGFSHGLAHGEDEPSTYNPGGAEYSKRRVRFEVDVPAIRWIGSSWYNKMTKSWRNIMIDTGGGIEAAEHWYIWPEPIKREHWVSVLDTMTEEKLT